MPEFGAKRQQNKHQAGPGCGFPDSRAIIANLRHAGKIRVIADKEEQRKGRAREAFAACRQENNYNQLMESK